MKRFFWSVCAALFFLMTQHAFAAEFTKNIRVIVPFAAGGGNDVIVRLLTDLAPKHLNGKQLIVENIPGGGAVIGTTAAAKSKPDGYTLIAHAASVITSVLTMPKEVTYKIETFIPLVMYCFDPVVLIVKKDSPHKDLESFLAAAREKPVNLNTPGNSTVQHLAGMILEKYMGSKINYVHTDSAGIQMTQILGGHVDATMCSMGEAASYLQEGSLRCLGIFSDKKFPSMPPMQPFSSVGLRIDGKNLEWGAMRGLAALAGTPAPMLQALEKAIFAMASEPAFAERMAKGGFPLVLGGSKEYQEICKTYETVAREMLARLQAK